VDRPLRVRYHDLDPKARYKVRVVYSGDAPKMKIRMVANGSVELHPFIEKPNPVRRLEFELPWEVTRGGTLELSWNRPPGLGGNGRGCQVSEIWLGRRVIFSFFGGGPPSPPGSFFPVKHQAVCVINSNAVTCEKRCREWRWDIWELSGNSRLIPTYPRLRTGLAWESGEIFPLTDPHP